jgi:type I restriction enzyme, S subunit
VAYELLHSNPDIFQVAPKLIVDRLDAVFLKPAYAKFDSIIPELEYELLELGSKKVAKLFTHMPGFSKDKWVEYVPTGIPYLLQINVPEGYIEPEGWEHITPEAHSHLATSSLEAGDILLTATGVYYGKAAVVPEWLPPANACPDILRLVLHEHIDPYYMVAYLNSEYGQIELRRHSSGAGRPRIITEYARKVRVVLPPRPLQTYIGAKVRLAEQCRRNGRELAQETEGFFDRILKRLPPTSSSVQTNAIEPSEIVTERLDAKFYQSIYIDIERYIVTHPEGHKTIGELVSSISNGVEYRDFVADGIPYLTVGNIRDGRLDLENAPKIPNDPSIPERGKIKANDILIVRTGSIGQSAFVRIDDSEAIISSHFIRLRLKQPQQAPWIVFFLNSWAGKLLQERITYGAVQPQIGQELLMGLPIPNIGADNSKYISAIVQKQYMLFDKATKLTKAAKTDVEALIEGRLDVAGIMDGRLQPPTWASIQQELSLTKSVSEPV